MKFREKVVDWLEINWIAPAYAGWILVGATLFFLAAAINTMTGWLYVISGVSFSLLLIAAILPPRSIHSLKIQRQIIAPVSVGEPLTIELIIENPTHQPVTLLQIQDNLPFVLSPIISKSIDMISPHSQHIWSYDLPAKRRGVYFWHQVQLRTAWPLGLFWCRRSREVKAKAIVYPKILPLTRCPLLESVGQESSKRWTDGTRNQLAQEGMTRTLRHYRMGDPTRLIHWRSSARYGELLVRELENSTGDREIIISLDSTANWEPEDFEAAVSAAASLYFWANRYQFNVKLWTAGTDIVYGNRLVLETLAGVKYQEEGKNTPPKYPLIWLTPNPNTLNGLPPGSRWILWPSGPFSGATKGQGLIIKVDQSLQSQLEMPMSNVF